MLEILDTAGQVRSIVRGSHICATSCLGMAESAWTSSIHLLLTLGYVMAFHLCRKPSQQCENFT